MGPSPAPTTGTDPNAGWFASTGGGASGDATAGAQYEPARVTNNIRLRSGENWSGERVLDVVRRIAPGWLPFFKRHVTLSATSQGATQPTTTIRSGEFGPKLEDLPKAPLRTLGPLTTHFEIPAKWNDIEVVRHILAQIADDVDVHQIAADSATRDPKLFQQIKSERFKHGLATVATLAGGYYSALATLTPGGQAAMAVWDIQEGDNLAAALDVAMLVPWGKLVKKGVEATGTVAIQAGDKMIGVLPDKAIQRLDELAPEQKELLRNRLLAAETAEDIERITKEFLETRFHAHHPLPMFLGGYTEQLLSKIPKETHDEFHKILRDELRNAGFDLPIGTIHGSAEKWQAYFKTHAGSQGKAFDAVLKASRAIDVKHAPR